MKRNDISEIAVAETQAGLAAFWNSAEKPLVWSPHHFGMH